MKKIKVYMHLDGRDKIDCICLRSNKGCDRFCEKESVLYDEFKGLKECFKNKDVKMTL